MIRLHPDLKIEVYQSHNGHGWDVRREGKLIGTGWAAGDVQDAFEDAIDDLRMLGLVETTEATSG